MVWAKYALSETLDLLEVSVDQGSGTEPWGTSFQVWSELWGL